MRPQIAPSCPELRLLGDGTIIASRLAGRVHMVDADHAATTRPLAPVWRRMEEVIANYGSVFRGSGPKSLHSSDLFEEALTKIVEFAGLPPSDYFVLVGRNTTEMLNRLARRLDLTPDDTVAISNAEHSSNELPWRISPARILRIPCDADGLVSCDALENSLRSRRPSKHRLITTITGASNVTGAFQLTRELTRLAHRFGSAVVVDASQLAPHRPICEPAWDDDERPDAVAFAGHKMYAPFGAGFLVLRRTLLESLRTEDIGGGSIDLVTPDDKGWWPSASILKRELAGSPNLFGVVGAALAGEYLRNIIGFAAIAEHEQTILDALRRRLEGVQSLRVYAPLNWSAERKCALVSFNLDGIEPLALAQHLAIDYGIAVRAGHLCQYALVERLLGLSANKIAEYRGELAAGRSAAWFGIVRASFGIGSTVQDGERLAAALEDVVTREGLEPLDELGSKTDMQSPWFT